MSLLNLPIFICQFPQDIEDKQRTLVMEVDATGDVFLILPDRIEASVEAERAFSVFWQGDDQKKLIKLLQQMFSNWQNPSRLLFDWHHYYQRRFKEEFKVTLLDWTAAIEKFFQDPFDYLTEKLSLKDITLLEVITGSQNSSEPFVATQIDWKGNISQTISPAAIGRDDVFSCHMKGVELALFIKAVLRDFLLRLLKKMVTTMCQDAQEVVGQS